MEDVKDAYRKQALKYHPKNDSSEEAATKFAEIGKAYQEIVEGERTKQMDNFGFRSFFDEFEKEVDEIFYPKRTKEINAEKESKEPKEKEQKEVKK